ncbi:MAG TPA: hypothetical protein VH475_08250 [Tepidisphaeraceae bacterium]|jgi:hypothetical protein
MPTYRRHRRIERRRGEGTREQCFKVLFDGVDWFDALRAEGFVYSSFGAEPSDEDMEVRRDYWEQHRDEVLAEWVAQHPGTRPWSWWHFAMSEPRRVIAGHEAPQNGFAPWRFMPGKSLEQIEAEWPAMFARLWDEHLKGNSQREYWYGCPSPVQSFATYESEFDYLDRLNLLLPGEREAYEAKQAKRAAAQERQRIAAEESAERIRRYLEGKDDE